MADAEKLDESLEDFAIELNKLYGSLYDFAETFLGEVNTFATEYVVPLLEKLEELESIKELEDESNPYYNNMHYEICMRCSNIYKSNAGFNEFYCSKECAESMVDVPIVDVSMIDKVRNLDLDRWKSYGK